MSAGQRGGGDLEITLPDYLMLRRQELIDACSDLGFRTAEYKNREPPENVVQESLSRIFLIPGYSSKDACLQLRPGYSRDCALRWKAFQRMACVLPPVALDPD